MAEARDDLARIERFPRELGDRLFVDLSTFRVELGLEVLDPAEDLLVREAVEGPREGVEARDVGVVGVAERRADEVRRVRGRVAALVVA